MSDWGQSVEEAAIRATVASIGRRFGHSQYAEYAAEGRFPQPLWDELAHSGFAGVNLPTRFGGGGGILRDLAAVAEELAAAGCPLMTLVVSPAICGPVLLRYGTDRQQERWLPGIASGSERMAFALTEPEAGSNSHNVATHARQDGVDWVLRGHKHYISGVEDAANVMVVARTGARASGKAALSLFVVPADSPSLGVAPIRTHVLAAERQSLLTFDDVRVPGDHLVGEEGGGLTQLFAGLNPERIMSAATCVGIGRYALEKASHYAKEREVWGVPIGTHQAIAHPLARAFIAIRSSSLLLADACSAIESGHEGGSAANMAKFAAAEAAAEALDIAIQTHGGHGLSHEYGLADLWGLTRLYGIAPVSREMTLNHIAVHELGLPKSY